MRAIFCGNLDYDARQSEIERIFKKYGRVERVDMKSGFAFVYMEDERDADVAVRKLDRIEFGRKGRRLRVEWTKQERDGRRSGGPKKPVANERPSRTLFVINFDPIHTRSKDLERHFDPYGKIANIRIRRNFSFIQFETQEEATRALEATNMSKLMDRVITVEYAIRDDDARDFNSEKRGRDSSPERGGYERRRSPSPYHRERDSPDYGYGRYRGSPDYSRGRSPVSKPIPRGSPGYARDESPANGRYRSRSPLARGRSRSRSPLPQGRLFPPRGRSPLPRGRSPLPRHRSPIPRSRSPRSPIPRGRSPLPRHRSPILRSRSPRSPIPRGRSPLLRDMSPIPRDRSRS